MLYRILLFVHVMAVIMWLGAGVVFQMLSERAGEDRDGSKMRRLAELGEEFGPGYFGGLTATVLVSGVALVLEGNWGFDHVFVIGGLVGILISGGIGGAVIGPTSKRLLAALEADGSPSDQARSDFGRIRSVGRIDLIVMVTVVYLMTVKPWE
ncbi:MAG TPA: DUF2269 family protein [Actinomycetota bacterium]